MTCITERGGFEAQIGDYVDGTLPDAQRAALEGHLSSCAGCRVLVADFRVIRETAQALEQHAPPPRVWARLKPALREAVEERPRLPFGRWFVAWQPLASAVVALIVVGSLSWIGASLSPLASPPQRVAVTSAVSTVPAAADPASVRQLAEATYTTAIADLEKITQAERTSLDPETAGVLQANLTVIDNAIVDSRDALRTQPESDVAQESLFDALRNKLALLQHTLALINEMRKGNEEGAARIVSGLNQ